MPGDYFSAIAPAYARFRPHYPDALFAWLAGRAPARRLAWDCATGSGQAAVGLASRFKRVIASDASAAQLSHAAPHPKVRYVRATAEHGVIRRGTVDLVCVAQALHWLDAPAFFAQAAEALAPHGVVAVWCYRLLEIEPDLDTAVQRFYHDVVGPFWPPERHHTEDGYRRTDFPFTEQAAPAFGITAELTLAELGGYLGTWSATARYREVNAQDPVPAFLDAVRPLWGAPERRRMARWPLALRVGTGPP